MQIKQNEKIAKEALTKIYSLKKEDQNLSTNKVSRIKSLSVLSHHEPARNSVELYELKTLSHEIEELKRKKMDVESELSYEKTSKYAAK